MSTKRVFVSDVHMSPGWSLDSKQGRYDWFNKDQAKQFAKFLQTMIDDATINDVVILGDLMDSWVYPIETQPPKYDKIANAPHITDVMANLKALAQKKKVIYVIGNHDMTLMEEQFSNFRTNAFANIAFKNFYETNDGLYAEHGHQYSMYNAVDPKHELPIGHYISRLYATVAERKQHYYISADFEARFPSTGKYNLDSKGLISDPMVNAPINLLEEELGNVDDSTSITTVNGGVITIAEVKKQYSRLGIDWTEQHGLFGEISSAWREGVGLDGVATQIAMGMVIDGQSFKIVIFGHTHKALNNYLRRPDAAFSRDPKDAEPYAIYANCGAWCQDNDPTYVIDEYDDKTHEHIITLKYFGKAGKDIVTNINST
ncbi:MAG TPA: metallophosphoesterase [Smithella sp.]|nr:metallophosphoesterase [Smithella sp.]